MLMLLLSHRKKNKVIVAKAKANEINNITLKSSKPPLHLIF